LEDGKLIHFPVSSYSRPPSGRLFCFRRTL
jgi:hypothetical protein